MVSFYFEGLYKQCGGQKFMFSIGIIKYRLDISGILLFLFQYVGPNSDPDGCIGWSIEPALC
jgi:hypothetical protein